MGSWSDSLHTQVVIKVVQKWDIPFSVWGAVPSTPPAVLLTPFLKPPKIFLPTPLVHVYKLNTTSNVYTTIEQLSAAKHNMCNLGTLNRMLSLTFSLHNRLHKTI